LLNERGMAPKESVDFLLKDINEILALTVSSIRTVKKGL
jgi:hypothetical protein